MRLEIEPGLDVTVLEAVLNCGQVEARQALARQLSALIADPDTSALERDQVIPVLMKLSTDIERSVRQVLAEELATVDGLHQDMIFSVIADEDEISLPFLAQTPALNSWHMQAILRIGDDARQRTVAARSDLSADAISFIVKAGSAVAAVALLRNINVKLGVGELRQIYARLGQSGDVVDEMLSRDDLPLDVRILQAKRSAVRMRQLMAERGWMPANDANDLVADAQEGAVLQVLKQANAADRAEGFQFLAAQNMLTPSLIVRAACMGDMEIVATALAHLCGHQADRIYTMMQSRGGAGIKSYLNRSMLPDGCRAIIASSAEVTAQAHEEDVELDPDNFGRRLLEVLMLQYGAVAARDQAKLMDYVSRFADDKVRKIARQLKSDMLRAA